MALPSCFGWRVSLRETEESAWLKAIRPQSAAPDARTELRKNALRSMGSIRPHRLARCNIGSAPSKCPSQKKAQWRVSSTAQENVACFFRKGAYRRTET